MYKKIKLYFRLLNLKNKLKRSDKKMNFLEDVKFDKYILIIDDKIPEFDKDSGSRRLTEVIKLLLKNNIGVFLLADIKEYRYESEYIDLFRNMGAIVYQPTLDDNRELITKDIFLKTVLPKTNYAWLHRPEIFDKYQHFIKTKNPKVGVFYDMVDFHYLRFKREALLTDNKKIFKIAQKYLELELKNCERADKIIIISELERQALKEYYTNDKKTIVIPNIHQHLKTNNFPIFKDRKDLLFIGGFDHSPNIDCVNYLYDEIMPLVWKEIPEIAITILGSKPPSSLMKLNSEKFKIVGYVKNVETYFLQARLFVAPLRYGAGIKGKIGQSLEYSLPLITTDVGAEGFDFSVYKQSIVGNTPEEIANNIIRMYTTEDLWNQISMDSKNVISLFSVDSIENKILQLIS